MLWHYRRRAEECASRIINSRSESVRQNYERLLESWRTRWSVHGTGAAPAAESAPGAARPEAESSPADD